MTELEKKALLLLDKFPAAFAAASCSQELMKILGIPYGTSGFRLIKRLCSKTGLDYKSLVKRGVSVRIKKGVKTLKDKTLFPFHYFGITSKVIHNGILKNNLLKFQVFEDKCSKCGCGNVWNGCKISLPIDHINGNRKDNRIGNLRILCPNCHSYTYTFCGIPAKTKEKYQRRVEKIILKREEYYQTKIKALI